MFEYINKGKQPFAPTGLVKGSAMVKDHSCEVSPSGYNLKKSGFSLTNYLELVR
ncbi:hypothetical protein [Brunnivagina elsteri]|uniref:hypothetical protein n=1 Tax=Brunnivagina elsteri TaxID=1247191 RepID=UPI00130402AE|nr:hypothetical protein [Calothrix elsteri]